MCIMEIHPGARTAAMIQALAHNASTWDRDADMFREELKARGRQDLLPVLDRAQAQVHAAYAGMLEAFGEESARLTMDDRGRFDHPHGGERTIVATMVSLTKAARQDETR